VESVIVENLHFGLTYQQGQWHTLTPQITVLSRILQPTFSYIPTAITSKHGLIVKQGGGEERWVDSREGLCNVIYDMASIAHAHSEKAQKLVASVPAEALSVLLPMPSQVLLDSLRKVLFDVFDPRLTGGVLGMPPLWYHLKLKWTSWRRIY